MDLLIKDVELPKRGELLTLTVRWTGHTWVALRNYKDPDVVRVSQAVEVNGDSELKEHVASETYGAVDDYNRVGWEAMGR